MQGIICLNPVHCVCSVLQERRDAFKFKQYLLMTRVFSDPLPQDQQQQQQDGAAGSSRGGPGKPPAGPSKPPKGSKQQQQQPAKKQKQQADGKVCGEAQAVSDLHRAT